MGSSCFEQSALYSRTSLHTWKTMPLSSKNSLCILNDFEFIIYLLPKFYTRAVYLKVLITLIKQRAGIYIWSKYLPRQEVLFHLRWMKLSPRKVKLLLHSFILPPPLKKKKTCLVYLPGKAKVGCAEFTLLKSTSSSELCAMHWVHDWSTKVIIDQSQWCYCLNLHQIKAQSSFANLSIEISYRLRMLQPL